MTIRTAYYLDISQTVKENILRLILKLTVTVIAFSPVH
jgi:hypothetical protein